MEQSQSNIGISLNENDKEGSFERREVEDTPFVLINEGRGWFITMGPHKLTEADEKASTNSLIRLITKKPWTLITMVIGIYTEFVIEQLKEREKGDKI